MWKLNVDLSWRDVKPKTFDDYEDAQWAFRGAVTKILGKDKTYFCFFMDLIDKYFAEFHGNNPLPKEVVQFKEFLTKYVTDPTYPVDTKNFTIAHYEDDNIEIYYNEKNKSVELRGKKGSDIVGKIPVMSIPVELDGFVSLLITNNPMLFAPIPGTETVNICLEPDEDEEDDDDYDDDDDEEDEDDFGYRRPPYSPPKQTVRTAPINSRPVRKPLTLTERIELNMARARFRNAVERYEKNKNTRYAADSRAEMETARMNLMRVEAKYGDRG